ncbi:hypothetical protein ACP6ET_12675, partial [Klebsiella quasipneumoniae]
NQRVSLGRNDLLIRTFLRKKATLLSLTAPFSALKRVHCPWLIHSFTKVSISGNSDDRIFTNFILITPRQRLKN